MDFYPQSKCQVSFVGQYIFKIHVMTFEEESGRFFFHFREVFEKCIEYIGKFLIHFREILNFCQKVVFFIKNFYQFYGSFPGVSLMMREVSHVYIYFFPWNIVDISFLQLKKKSVYCMGENSGYCIGKFS